MPVSRPSGKFTSASNTEAVALRSKESLGRDISREVATEGGAIPETVVLDVPVWTTPGLDTSYRLTCAVEVDLERGMFALVPLPDEIERVENLAIEQIRERLADDLPEFAAFHGSP